MTPKDKAEELVRSMLEIDMLLCHNIKRNVAIKCAIIAVEEIFAELTDTLAVYESRMKFWNDVLNELKSMQ